MIDFNRFKAGEIAIVCKTREEALKFHELAGEAGVEWLTGESPRVTFGYNEHYSKPKGGNTYQCGYGHPREKMTYGCLDSLLVDKPDKYEIVFFDEINTLEINPDDFLSLLMGDTQMEQRELCKLPGSTGCRFKSYSPNQYIFRRKVFIIMFNIDDFRAGKIAVICTSKEQTQLFHNIVGDAGIRWTSGSDPRSSLVFNDKLATANGGVAYHCCFSSPREGMSYSNLHFLTREHPDKYEIVFFNPLSVNHEQFMSLLEGDD